MIVEKPLNDNERRNYYDMAVGCLNRLCVSDDEKELLVLLGSLMSFSSILAQSRFLILKEKKINKGIKIMFENFDFTAKEKKIVYRSLIAYLNSLHTWSSQFSSDSPEYLEIIDNIAIVKSLIARFGSIYFT